VRKESKVMEKTDMLLSVSDFQLSIGDRSSRRANLKCTMLPSSYNDSTIIDGEGNHRYRVPTRIVFVCDSE